VRRGPGNENETKDFSPRSQLPAIEALYKQTLGLLAPSDQGLGEFGEYVFGYRPAAHHQIWIDLLQNEDIKKLIIVAPPGHAKSTWCSVIYPAWKLGRDPTLHYLGTSVTATQSHLFSVAIRDTIGGSSDYQAIFPEVRPDRAKGWGESEWFIERPDVSDPHSTFAASGVGGPIIGRRADEIGLDDPYDERNSETADQRKKVLTWLNRTLKSRLAPEGRFRAVLTRWHFDDFVQEFEDQGTYTVVRMLALSEGKEVWADVCPAKGDREYLEATFGDRLEWNGGDDSGGRIFIHDRGPALWPEFWGEEALVDKRIDVGIPIFECMYQGNPAALSGEIFKIDYFRQWPANFELVAVKTFWDTKGVGKTKRASYTVGVTGGRDVWNNFYVLLVRRSRPTSLGHKTTITEAWDSDSEVWSLLDQVGVESGLVSDSLLAELIAEGDIPIEGVTPVGKGDKVKRARPVAAKGEAGRLFVDKTAPWWPTYLSEFLAFDRGKYDDQVDATSGLYWMLFKKKRWGRPKFLKV
jgi:predicted phage terminase large subunit-like protein